MAQADTPDSPALRTRRVWLTAGVMLLAVWVGYEFLVPVAWATVLAIAQWPLFRRALARAPHRAGWLAAGFALVTALVVIVPLSLATVTLAQESQAAMDWLQHAQHAGIAAPGWLPGLPLVGGVATRYWQQHIGNPHAANAVLGTLSAGSVLGWTRSIGGEVAREAGLFLVTLLALVTFLAHGQAIDRQARHVARRLLGGFGAHFLVRMTAAVRATVNGTVLVSVAEGVTIGIGYGVAGVPQPLLLATFTIALALVPFGAWLAFGLASLILLGGGKALAAGLLFAFGAAVMTVGDNLVQPSVIGSAVKLPFLLALVGAFGGLAEMGLVGLFIGPVVMAALLLVWQQWTDPVPPDPSGQ